jgi:hypothetical protein
VLVEHQAFAMTIEQPGAELVLEVLLARVTLP